MADAPSAPKAAATPQATFPLPPPGGRPPQADLTKQLTFRIYLPICRRKRQRPLKRAPRWTSAPRSNS